MTANVRSSGRRAPARRGAAGPRARDRRPAGVRWNASRKPASSSARPARTTLAAAAPERQAPAEHAGPGRVFPDGRVEAGKRRAGQKGRFGVAFRRVPGPRPGGKRRRRGGRRPRSRQRISAREHGAKATARRRFRLGLPSKTAGLVDRISMSDKVALSDIYRLDVLFMSFLSGQCAPRRRTKEPHRISHRFDDARAASDARLSTYLRGSLVNVGAVPAELTITRRCNISPCPSSL